MTIAAIVLVISILIPLACIGYPAYKILTEWSAA